MIETAIILSLQITGIYILFQEGMLLAAVSGKVEYWLGRLIGQKSAMYVLKPVWGCLICMASVWTIVLTWSFDLKLIFLVCGINVLINKFINE